MVCLCVLGDADIEQVTDGDTGVFSALQPGSVIAVHSTVHPGTVRVLAEKAAALNVAVIDAPVSGGGPAEGRRPIAGDGGRRRGRAGAVPTGVRYLRQPHRASGRARIRPNDQAAEQFADFSGPFPVEVITRMAGVPEEYRQQVRHWIDTSLHREPGQALTGAAGMQANIDSAMYYFSLVQQRREEPQDDMISRLIAAEIPGEDGRLRKLDDIEITGFAVLLGGAGAETVTKLIGTAAVIFARYPEQWHKLGNDRSKLPAAVEALLRYEGPVQYNVRYTLKEARVSGGTIPAGKPVFLIGASANREPEAFADAEVFDIDRDRSQAQNLGLGYGIHGCLGAALARMESAIALDKLLDFMPRYEVDWDGLQRVHMQNVAGYQNVPVKVSRPSERVR
jgi:cytochrome P450